MFDQKNDYSDQLIVLSNKISQKCCVRWGSNVALFRGRLRCKQKFSRNLNLTWVTWHVSILSTTQEKRKENLTFDFINSSEYTNIIHVKLCLNHLKVALYLFSSLLETESQNVSNCCFVLTSVFIRIHVFWLFLIL